MEQDGTVMITGGTGFIGSYATAAALEAGIDVALYDVRTETAILERLGIEEDVPLYEGDVSDEAALRQAVKEAGATQLIHLAALLRQSARKEPSRAARVNVLGATAALEVARQLDLERVVLASSETVYAPQSAYPPGPVTEESLVKPATIYAAAKLYNERQAATYAEDHGVSTVCLRPTGVYGPYRETGSAQLYRNLIARPALGESSHIPQGNLRISWLYVKDAARAFLEAVSVPANVMSRLVYNIPGEVATVREVAEVVGGLVPDAELTVGEEHDEWSAQSLDGTAAKEDFGFEPRFDIAAGVRDFVNTVRREAGRQPVDR